MNHVDITFQISTQDNYNPHDILCCDVDQLTTK